MQKRILIVDNEPSLTFFLAENLTELGPEYEIETCHSGVEAITLTSTGPFDLVITDFWMPVINGLQLSRFLNQRYPQIKIILITAYGNEALMSQARELDVTYYITKPFELEEMLTAVRTALEDEQESCPAAQGRQI